MNLYLVYWNEIGSLIAAPDPKDAWSQFTYGVLPYRREDADIELLGVANSDIERGIIMSCENGLCPHQKPYQRR